MAESPFFKLQEQLTCTICLDLYINPKTLPCLHSFCLKCLEALPLVFQGDNYRMACPVCRNHVQLPEPTGAAGFPTTFHLNNIKEIHSLMKKASNEQVTCDNCAAANAIAYCKDCCRFLCQKCVNTHKNWLEFANHQMTNLGEVASTASHLVLSKQQQATFICTVPGHDGL